MPIGSPAITMLSTPQNENRHSGPSWRAYVSNGMNPCSSGTNVSVVVTSWLPVPRRPMASQVSRISASVRWNTAKRQSGWPLARTRGRSPSTTSMPLRNISAWGEALQKGHWPLSR